MDEYYRFTRQYSASYFRGRVEGTDEDEAEVEVTFRLGPHSYQVRRGLFEPDQLRGLTITDRQSGDAVVEIRDETPRSERHATYTSTLVLDCGVSSFEEFVFLQHFVFTFDERRATLFWNQQVLERVLYRAFGVTPDMAKQADSVRREIEHTDSRVRNLQFEATKMRRRINQILKEMEASIGAQDKFDTLTTQHAELSKQFDEETKTLRKAEDGLRDVDLQLAQNAALETSLRDDYASYFEEHLHSRPPLSRHPLLVRSLAEESCGLCGQTGTAAMETIRSGSTGTKCPLCNSDIQNELEPTETTDRLHTIDSELSGVKGKIRSLIKTREKLHTSTDNARRRWEDLRDSLDGFDRDNSAILEAMRQLLNKSVGASSLDGYREQLAVVAKEKRQAYEKREELKQNLGSLQTSLATHYAAAEETFVPLFETLAQKFLGMSLSVRMDSRAGPNLVVTVQGQPRRQQQQLSESQRFFLDIALRMALIQFMSEPEAKGFMFIDTPEGSLDIAYEKRAGDMLALFTEAGHGILMTANLNTSQLLLALARRCGKARMLVVRITDWAELSEVQKGEEELFNSAYDQIESALAEADTDGGA